MVTPGFQNGTRRNYGESLSQQALIQWWDLAHNGLGVPDKRLLFSIPNGGPRNPVTAAILCREGLRAGVPDLFLAVPRGSYHGLFIEMKTPHGAIQVAQYEVMTAMEKQCFAVAVCRGSLEAQEAIESYLRDVKTP